MLKEINSILFYSIILTSNKIWRDICQVYTHLHEYDRPICLESALTFENTKLLIVTIDKNNAGYDTPPIVD